MIELREVIETENEINKEEDIDKEMEELEGTPVKEIDLVDILTKARLGGSDNFLEDLMKELEWAEEIVYGENLTSSNYIYWKTRYETLKEIKNKYCDYLDKKLKK